MTFFDTIKQVDQSLFFFLNEMHNPFWDVVMSLFTRTEVWGMFFLVLIYFIIKRYQSKSILILLFLALSIVISDQFSVFIKDTVQRFRPSHEPAIQELVHTVIKKGGLYGYFSSHATNTFAVAMLLARVFCNFRFTILIFCWAIFVSYTRIYLGLHYPGDIISGAIVGCLIGWGLFVLNQLIEKRFFNLTSSTSQMSRLENHDFKIVLIVLIFVFAMVLFIVNRLQYIHIL